MFEVKINDNIFNFEYQIIKSDYFNNSEDTIFKVLKNIKINQTKANKEEIKLLISYIKENNILELEIKEENKYLSNSNIKNNKNFICLSKNTKTQNIELLFSKKINIDFKYNKENENKFLSDFIFDNHYFYLNDGLSIFLDIFIKNIFLKEEFNNKDKIILSYFFKPSKDIREKNYINFIKYCFINNMTNNSIDTFFRDKNILNNILIIENDYFNYSHDYIENFLLYLLQDELNWSECYFISNFKGKAILLCEDELFFTLKEEKLEQNDFIFNSLINMMNKCEDFNKTNKNIISIQHKNKEYLIDTNLMVIFNDDELFLQLKHLKFKNIMSFYGKLITIWKNLKNNID